ncbi:hypothetical protein KP79_PYT18763 [Mizuhopecten yessoensis]|uniref:Uncharacterized protein n=1 Tax=Mizuhopecten yessoensis TaxID=6573 RepID=A0A210Q3H3_MIZYE|nr:hypothetical protein KP79_PYT18763 [Mizuhopecten yessoensis]
MVIPFFFRPDNPDGYNLGFASRSKKPRPFTIEKYNTIYQLMTGTFRVPVKQRTLEQKNAIRQFQRCRHEFDVVDNRLLYRGKELDILDDNSINRRYRFSQSYVKTSQL